MPAYPIYMRVNKESSFLFRLVLIHRLAVFSIVINLVFCWFHLLNYLLLAVFFYIFFMSSYVDPCILIICGVFVLLILIFCIDVYLNVFIFNDILRHSLPAQVDLCIHMCVSYVCVSYVCTHGINRT